MGINYDKLWKLLKKQSLNKTYLRAKGIHPTSIAKMGKNEYIDTRILARICEILHCDFSDIMEYVPDIPKNKLKTDYNLENESTDIKELFIDKLIDETKKCNLNWKEYISEPIKDNIINGYFEKLNLKTNNGIIQKKDSFAYELEYDSFCLYYICDFFNNFLKVILLMQIDKNNLQDKNNFSIIATTDDNDDTLEKITYLGRTIINSNHYQQGVEDKSYIIMRNFINGSISSS